MKLSPVLKIFLFTVILPIVYLTGLYNSRVIAQPAQGMVSKMLNTKHNLGVAGSGTVKATSEKQICVFCHTPHVPKEFIGEQLWNHQLSTAEYTLYSSDYLTNLNYLPPNQPNPRSKLCLSCHDGTIAIGAVYNNYGPRTIMMQNDVTAMPTNVVGNLGVSLANDHPVGFIYDNSKDPELISRIWPWKTPIKLDPDAANGTVECITCHEPHDDQFGKFLRVSNANSSLCTFCHSKTGWQDAIHQTSLQNYTPPGGSTTTIGEHGCRNCHISHGGFGVPYLLPLIEENTCYPSGCHGNSETGTNTKNIKFEMDKVYSHPTNTVTGKHKNPDNETSLGINNRHTECQDCHNLHQAKKGLHSLQGNQLSNVLKGASGVIPGYAAAWTQPTSFSELKPAQQENQICFKCHSYYAFGVVVDGVTTIIGLSNVNITDQAMEFNPANGSAHPVRVPLNEQSGSIAPKALDATQMNSSWNSVGNQSMYCSDCHGNDRSTSSIVPQGPHGSESRFMLTGNAKYWPLHRSSSLWSLDDIKNNRNFWQSDLFCVNCHPMYQSGNFLNKVHDKSEHQGTSVKCITCHVVIPHGAQNSRLIGYAGEVPPYNYAGSDTYDKLVITSFQKAAGPFDYEKNNCSMNGVCHDGPGGFNRR